MNRQISKLILLPLLFLSWSQLVIGQGAKFQVLSDKTQVKKGETFVIEIQLENQDESDFKWPASNPFKIVQGPFTSSSFSMINGTTTKSKSFRYEMLASEKGNFQLGPFTLKIGSKELKSNILKINVIEPSNVATNSDPNTTGETLMRLECNAPKGYIGQQILTNLVLYTRKSVSRYELVSQPTFEGFYAQPIENHNEMAGTRQLNGVSYQSQTLMRYALFPQKKGSFKIGPWQTTVDVPLANSSPFGFATDSKKEALTTNAVQIEVIPLPETKDSSFTGGVGDFELVAGFVSPLAGIGQPIKLRLKITGNGDPKLVLPPKFAYPPGLETYPATLIDERFETINNELIFQKEWEYVFVPKEATDLVFEPKFTYFDPIAANYKTLKSDPLRVKVTSSSANNVSDIDLNNNDDSQENVALYKRPLWIILGMGALGSIIFLLLQRSKTNKSITKTKPAISIKTKAQLSLSKAKSLMEQGDKEGFYNEIAAASQKYIMEKYKIPNMDSDLSDVVQVLSKNGVSAQLIESYKAIYNKCELARFASIQADMPPTYIMAVKFLDQLDV